MGYIMQESNNGFIFTNPDKKKKIKQNKQKYKRINKMKKKSKRINRGK
mgnify:FL=1